MRKKAKKQRRSGSSTGLPTQATHGNHVWSYDFVADQTIDGRRLRCLTVIDECPRQCLTIEISRSLTAADVKQVLTVLFEIYGQPSYIRSDNGAEFTARSITDWLKQETKVKTFLSIQVVRWQNGFNDRNLKPMMKPRHHKTTARSFWMFGGSRISFSERKIGKTVSGNENI